MTAQAPETDLQIPEPIHRPDLQTPIQRGAFAVLSLLGWLAWLYLFVPLLTVLAWAFGVHRFDRYVLGSVGVSAFTLSVYAVIIVAAGLTLVLWAIYNLLRFRGKDRRSPPPTVSEAALASAVGLEITRLRRLRRARVAWVRCDDLGRIAQIEAGPPVDRAGAEATRDSS
ncbi:MAG TPA: poly-beta-1,6-N-acetyl-D-glucosamine biosynthesis protein PgaD [Gammaproteobacteria bacterium]|nr:poly-beta-1,6-N-acetyl-D-glucosamine biosynthesis protein PgaD [Gammaproteobacteria bacterium]